MRRNLDKKHFTKAERILGELLKRNRVPFKAKVLVDGREIDFLVGMYAIEVDGHDQEVPKNDRLVILGYVPVHISNQEILNHPQKVEQILLKINDH